MGVRVVYLDVDGVLTTPRRAAAMGRDSVDPIACALVNELLEASGTLVVVSSTWRRDASCVGLLLAAGLGHRFHEDWRTPPWPPVEALADPERPRGSEIELHGRANGVEDYVVLDDDPGMLDHQRPRHVRTRTSSGLRRIHVELALDVLLGSTGRGSKGDG